MPQPVPHLHEILALEAKIHADKYDLYPQPKPNDRYTAMLECKLEQGILYIKR